MALGILAGMVALSAGLYPSLENYRFKKDQKKMIQALQLAHITAHMKHMDVIVEFENEKNGLGLRLFSEEQGEIFFKNKEHNFFLKNIEIKDRSKVRVCFSATGWIFPIKLPLNFLYKHDDKKKFSIKLEKMFEIEMDKKIPKENLYHL